MRASCTASLSPSLARTVKDRVWPSGTSCSGKGSRMGAWLRLATWISTSRVKPALPSLALSLSR